ncbi:tetratricopeptide repeat protein [Gracilimonas mengyeensis]|uniref:Outer membrane protein assembly factor BamD, BamD/ComL family n=1 Tax=Gracilimonas mengyeensis TaxID=1302730 RepID=A0A521B556_9BACT|nr:tetratricopeptide repeat protein [Gracilimonas mengyeensis]SMO42181.1 Outer membrane protein assembly factor BamD, BamD/ComL family [Gracilimonas mengyeensis]
MQFVPKSTFLVFLLFVVSSQSIFSQDLQSPATQLYRSGIDLYEKGFYEESAQHFSDFTTSYPEHDLRISAEYYLTRAKTGADSANIEAYYQDFVLRYPGTDLSEVLLKDLGHRFTDAGEYEAAIEYYQQAVDSWMKEKSAAETKYWIAEAAAENQDYEYSRQYFMAVADDHLRSSWAPKALYARGRLYLEEEKYDASTEAFEVLRDRFPNSEITRRVGTALGEAYYQQGRYEEATEALRSALPHLDTTSRTKAVFLIAESQNYLGNYDEASKAYLQYINLTKGTPEERIAHYGLGWLYNKQEIYHWAAESFGRAATGDDEIARKALYYKAVNEKLGSQYGKSLDSFREFGDRFKEGFWVEKAYYEWAVSAFEVSRYDEAIEVLLELVRSDMQLEDAGKVYTMLGEAFYANAEYTRALQAFEEAEKAGDISPQLKRQARFQKAWIMYRNQAYEQAQPGFEAVYAEAPQTEIGKEALFWSADTYYKMNQYSQAARRFKMFVDNYPDDTMAGAALYSLGWSYFEMGQFQNAVGPLRNFLQNYKAPDEALFPYDTDTQLRIGDAYYAVGNYQEAIASYSQALGAEPGGDYAMFQIANSYYRAGRTFDAVSNFRKTLRIYPYSRLREQAQYNIAYIYLNTNNYSQAVEEFKAVISKYPGTHWAARSQYNIGDAYYNAGEYERAIQAYKKVLDEYPRSDYIIEAINGIQYAQLSAGRSDSSSAILEDFLSDNPTSATADQLRYRQALNVFQSGDYENAISEFRQYLRVTNSEELVPETYANLAEAYQQTDQAKNALEAYRTIADEYPDSDQAPSALSSMGTIQLELGRNPEAHTSYTRLLDSYPRFRQEAYVGMGNASLAQGKTDQAKQEFESALEVNANSQPAKVGLGKVAVSNGNYERAREMLVPVAESSSTEIGAEAQYYVGQMLQKQGSYNEAIEEYAKVKVLFEAFDYWVSQAMYNGAECHIRMGNRGEAMTILNSIINDYPGTDAQQKAQALLERSGES